MLLDPAKLRLQTVALAVIDDKGSYAGLIGPRDLLRALGPEPNGNHRGPIHPDTMVAEAARTDVPALAPDANLATMLLAVAQTDAPVLPVLDEGRLLGFVPGIAVFQAVCGICLSESGEELPFLRDRGQATVL